MSENLSQSGPPKRKRKAPRKRAVNEQQAREQLERFNKLLDKQLSDLATIAKRVIVTRRKASYYQTRVDKLQTDREEAQRLAREAARQANGRPSRSLTVRGGG